MARKSKTMPAGRRAPAKAGKQYRVLGRGVHYPTSEEAIARIQAGEKVPFEERAMVEAGPGEIITDVPDGAAQSLLGQGLVEEFDPARFAAEWGRHWGSVEEVSKDG